MNTAIFIGLSLIKSADMTRQVIKAKKITAKTKKGKSKESSDNPQVSFYSVFVTLDEKEIVVYKDKLSQEQNLKILIQIKLENVIRVQLFKFQANNNNNNPILNMSLDQHDPNSSAINTSLNESGTGLNKKKNVIIYVSKTL